jgi:putative ABC transport system permease protein
MWKILLEEFIGDLKTQKLRTTLTMFAMTWGTIAVVLLLAFGEGLKVAVERGLINAGERIFMVYGGETGKIHQGLPTGRRIRLTEEDLQLLLRSIPEIEMGSPSYGRWGTSLKWEDTKTNTYMAPRPTPTWKASTRSSPRCAACSRGRAAGSSTSRTWNAGGGCCSWGTTSQDASSTT